MEFRNALATFDKDFDTGIDYEGLVDICDLSERADNRFERFVDVGGVCDEKGPDFVGVFEPSTELKDAKQWRVSHYLNSRSSENTSWSAAAKVRVSF